MLKINKQIKLLFKFERWKILKNINRDFNK